MRKYKLAFFSIFILFGTRVILDTIIKPIYFKDIIDALSRPVADKLILKYELLHILLIIVIIHFVIVVISRLGKFIIFNYEINVIQGLRSFSFQKINRHSQTFFANTFSGSLVTKSRRFVGSFEQMFDILVYDFYFVSILLTGSFIVIYNKSHQLAFFFLAFAVVYISIVLIFVKYKIKYDIAEAQADSRIGGRLADVFGNILAVKIFSAHKNENASFGEVILDSKNKMRKSWFFILKAELVQIVLIFITQNLLLYVMINLWVQDKITAGTIVLVQTYMILIFDKLWSLSNSTMRFMKAAADMKEIIDIFEVTPDILDPEKPEVLAMNKGHLVFNNVDFVYKNGQQVLKNFNLDIKPGERIGVVGHSGAGKSTITNLILRFMDVTAGSITIDGQDIRNVTQDDLRSVISYVPQESILFHRTIRENIAYGKPDATDEEVREVAKKAHANEFISKLPYKYDTHVGERGIKLSGGERQRIAIARAMIKDSPILILDEATSSLDSISEQYIQEAFNELMKNKTTIVIAHRLSTIQKMDRIIVLEEGDIVEQGTHQELLEKKQQYANLWNHQVGGFIE